MSTGTLTARGKAMRFCSTHRGVKESPPGSNKGGLITVWQIALATWLVGTAWCGTYAAAALRAAGVVVTWRLASVSLIEDDARAGRGPFVRWLAPSTANVLKMLRGSLVVWFGRGVHVGVFRSVKYVRGVGWVIVDEEGNTTSQGGTGSQSNGGMTARRERPLSQAYGFAVVDFPGGRRAMVAAVARSVVGSVVGIIRGPSPELRAEPSLVLNFEPSSDKRLLAALEGMPGAARAALRAEMIAAGVRA